MTGWGARDEQFFPLLREYFSTSTYAGVEQTVPANLHLRTGGEYLRTWRLKDQQFAIAQAFRPPPAWHCFALEDNGRRLPLHLSAFFSPRAAGELPQFHEREESAVPAAFSRRLVLRNLFQELSL